MLCYLIQNSNYPVMGPRGGRISPTTLSSWNIRSGCSQAQLERITLDLGNDDIDFCAVQEVRLPDSGERDLESVHHKKGKTYKYKLLFSGLTPEEGRHHGVGLFIKESRKAFLEKWDFSRKFPGRILWAQFTGCNIISFYGFTETSKTVSQEALLEKKLALYAELNSIYAMLPDSQPTFFCGDFNARIGFEGNPKYNVGRFGDYTEKRPNENGSLMMEMALKHSLCVISTFFRKPRRKKWSWRFWMKTRKGHLRKFTATLDHILLHGRWRSWVQDCEFRPLKSQISDHRRLDLKVTMKWKINLQPKIRPRYDFFHDPVNTKVFLQTMDKCPTPNRENVDSHWNTLMRYTRRSATKVQRTTKAKKCSTSIASATTQEFWRIKSLSGPQRELSKESFKNDYDRHWRDQGREMEEASKNGDQRRLYTLMHKSLKPPTRKKAADVHAFAASLREKLNTSHSCTPLNTVGNHIPLDEPTYSEILSIASGMKNNRAPGEDDLPMEIWKLPEMCARLFLLIQDIWQSRTIPKAWYNIIIVPVPKKQKNKFRPISLLITAFKVYLKWLQTRLTPTVLAAAGPTQSGFLPHRSTMDPIMYFLRHREQGIEFQMEKWFIFSDVKSAFDTVNRSSIINVLTDKGASGHLIELVHNSMHHTRAKARTSSEESEYFAFNNGVPQGSSLSPSLFITSLGFAVSHANSIYPTTHREFADDLSNVTADKNSIIDILSSNSQSLELIGTKLEAAKTEIFHVCPDGTEEVYKVRDLLTEFSSDISFDEYFVKTADQSLRYLGTQFGSPENAFKDRLLKANQAFARFYHKLWNRANVSPNTKILVFNACIISILLYGLKCHAATRRLLRKLDYFCLRKLKVILGLAYDAKVSYAEMSRKLKSFGIKWEWPGIRLQKQRLRFFLDSIKEPEIEEVMLPPFGCKRKIGRPKFRLIDALINDLDDVADIHFADLRDKDCFKCYKERAEQVIYCCTIHEAHIRTRCDDLFEFNPGRNGS